MAPLILFDIDRTLFDTDRRATSHIEVLQSHLNISKNFITEVRNQYFPTLKNHTDFNAATYLKKISSASHLPFSAIKSAFYDPKDFLNCLFPETLSVLARLQNKYTLGIYSEGFVPFQTKKLELTNLLPFFNPEYIYFFRRKTSPASLSKIPSNSIIIDDNFNVINALVKSKNFTPVWLNRKDTSKHPTAQTIHSLSELPLPVDFPV